MSIHQANVLRTLFLAVSEGSALTPEHCSQGVRLATEMEVEIIRLSGLVRDLTPPPTGRGGVTEAWPPSRLF